MTASSLCSAPGAAEHGGRSGRSGHADDGWRSGPAAGAAASAAAAPRRASPPHCQSESESGLRSTIISHFFIDRPIFASVLSILITLTGRCPALAADRAVSAHHAARRVDIHSLSRCQRAGGRRHRGRADRAAGQRRARHAVHVVAVRQRRLLHAHRHLRPELNLNTALVMVQNRVALAMPQLPVDVQMQGITIKKKTPDILLVVNFYSPDDRYDDIYLSNYAYINVRDELFRVEGVSDINVLGKRDYSIRVWLDPQKLASRNMTPLEVAAAIRTQNVEAASGQVGQQPQPQGQPFQFPVDTLGRLRDPEQFANIIIKVGQGSPLGRYQPAPVILSQPTGSTTGGGSVLGGGGLGATAMNGGSLGGGFVGGGGMIGKETGLHKQHGHWRYPHVHQHDHHEQWLQLEQR